MFFFTFTIGPDIFEDSMQSFTVSESDFDVSSPRDYATQREAIIRPAWYAKDVVAYTSLSPCVGRETGGTSRDLEMSKPESAAWLPGFLQPGLREFRLGMKSALLTAGQLFHTPTERWYQRQQSPDVVRGCLCFAHPPRKRMREVPVVNDLE